MFLFSKHILSQNVWLHLVFSLHYNTVFCIVCKGIQQNFKTRRHAGIFPSQHFMQWSIASTFLLHCWWPSRNISNLCWVNVTLKCWSLLLWFYRDKIMHNSTHDRIMSRFSVTSKHPRHLLMPGDANRHRETGSSLVKLMDCRLFGAKLLVELTC